MFAKIENRSVEKFMNQRPKNWRTDNGPLTEAEWIEQGYYPVQSAPAYDPATEKLVPIPQDQWVVNATDVGPTHEVVALTQAELDALAAQQQQMLIDSYTNQIQSRLDSKAQERQYDHILSAVTYLGDPNPQFAAEAEALRQWRSDTWATANGILHDVLSGNRSAPSIEQLLSELPSFVWPEVA